MKRRRAPIHQIVDVLIAFGDLKLRAAVFFSPSAMQSAFEKKRLSQELPAAMFLYRRQVHEFYGVASAHEGAGPQSHDNVARFVIKQNLTNSSFAHFHYSGSSRSVTPMVAPLVDS